jgi:hypothetical protein
MEMLGPAWLANLDPAEIHPAHFQTGPPACYRAPWRLPGPDFHLQATTSF